MDNATRHDAEVIATLAAASLGVLNQSGVPFVVVPPDHKVESTERLLLRPARVRGVTTVDDFDSFIRYALPTSDDIEGQVFWRASETAASFACVFNPQTWRDHRVVYTPTPSIEWRRWTGMNGQHKPQTEFATFIEDNAPDIVSPSSSDMIEISRSLEAKKKVSFASGVRLSNGQQELTYEEQIEGTAAKGKLQIPETFSIGIPVFVGGDRYKVDARLRYRIDNAKLSIWYDLVRPHLVIEDAVSTMVATIRDKVQLPMYRGDLGALNA